MTNKALGSLPAVSSLDTGDLLYAEQGGNSRRAQVGNVWNSMLTTRGDIAVRGASTTQRLALGTSGYHLQSDGTDAGWAGFLQAGTGAATRTWQAKGRDRVSPEDFGAVGDGSTDDSDAWTEAIEYLDGIGGGTIDASPGATYIVEGLPLAERVYINLNGAILRLPSSPTAAMFIAPSGFTDNGDNSGFQGGGIMHGELDGVDSTQRGVDFTLNSMGRLERFILDDVYLHDFSRAYSGSLNDRQPSIVNCRIHDNTVGVHIVVGHPYIRNTAFRTNDIGLTANDGSSVDDMMVVGCFFAFNGIHVQPGSSGVIENCFFIGCGFYRADTIGITINKNCLVSGCFFVGINDSDIGLVLAGQGNVVTGNSFGLSFNENANDSFGSAAIRVDGDADDSCITGNVFWVLGAGHGIIDNNGTFRCLNVSGNTTRIAGGQKFLSSTMSGANTVFHPNINGNTFNVLGTGLDTGDGIIDIADLGDLGANITNNVFFASGGTISQGHALVLPNVTASIITGNKFRNFSDPISADTGSAASARWGLNVASPGGLTHMEAHGALQSYTVATLPTASPSAMLAYVTDDTGAGGPVPVFSDGTAWRRVTDRETVP